MATVIKGTDVTARQTAQMHVFNFTDIEAEAHRHIAEAKAQAERIIAEARRQAGEFHDRAYQEGHRDGLQKGLEEGRHAGHDQAFKQSTEQFRAQQAVLIESCRQIVADLDEKKTRFLLAARTDVIRLATTIARRVIKSAMARRASAEAAAADNVAEALEIVGARTDVIVRVHPDVLAAMERFAKELAQSAEAARHVRLTPDASVSPGGCIVTTAEGSVDASIETQIERVVELLLGAEDAPQTRAVQRTGPADATPGEP